MWIQFFANASYIQLFYEFLKANVLSSRASSLFVEIYNGNKSGICQPVLRDFLLLKDYFYASVLQGLKGCD